MFRTYKITNTFWLALIGLLVAAQSTVAQTDDVLNQQSPSDIGALSSGVVQGQLESQSRVSNLYSKFSGANDVQREAIIQSLQGIVQQLESQRGTSGNISGIQSGGVAENYPTTGSVGVTNSFPAQSYPAQSYPAQSYPAQSYPVQSYPMAAPMQAPVESYPAPYQAAVPAMASFDPGPAMPAAPTNNVVNNYFYGAPQVPAAAPMAPAPMPQPQPFVEYGPVFQMPQPQVIRPVIKILVPVVVPTMQAPARHGCRLFHH